MRKSQAWCNDVLLLVGGIMLAACHRADSATDKIAVISGRQSAPRPAALTARTAPHVGPVAIPTIAASLPGPNPQLAKPAFRSPPLSPELIGDGGLTPLPPLPPPSAFGGGNQQ